MSIWTKSRITFDVRGLVLAGGNSIGTPGRSLRSRERSFATPTAARGETVLVDTPLVELSDQGEAQFNGKVSCVAGRVLDRTRCCVPDSGRRWQVDRQRDSAAVATSKLDLHE